MVDAPPNAVAKAREATTVRAAQVKPPADVPADYLRGPPGIFAGRGHSGRGAMLRAVATTPPSRAP